MLTSAGAKLLDFGLAKATTRDLAEAASSELTTPGTIIGTVQYMAPEQLEGLQPTPVPICSRLGCVLYEMLAGRKAFEGRTGASLLTAIMALEPTPLRELVPVLPDDVERRGGALPGEESRRSLAVGVGAAARAADASPRTFRLRTLAAGGWRGVRGS